MEDKGGKRYCARTIKESNGSKYSPSTLVQSLTLVASSRLLMSPLAMTGMDRASLICAMVSKLTGPLPFWSCVLPWTLRKDAPAASTCLASSTVLLSTHQTHHHGYLHQRTHSFIHSIGFHIINTIISFLLKPIFKTPYKVEYITIQPDILEYPDLDGDGEVRW